MKLLVCYDGSEESKAVLDYCKNCTSRGVRRVSTSDWLAQFVRSPYATVIAKDTELLLFGAYDKVHQPTAGNIDIFFSFLNFDFFFSVMKKLVKAKKEGLFWWFFLKKKMESFILFAFNTNL